MLKNSYSHDLETSIAVDTYIQYTLELNILNSPQSICSRPLSPSFNFHICLALTYIDQFPTPLSPNWIHWLKFVWQIKRTRLDVSLLAKSCLKNQTNAWLSTQLMCLLYSLKHYKIFISYQIWNVFHFQ